MELEAGLGVLGGDRQCEEVRQHPEVHCVLGPQLQLGVWKREGGAATGLWYRDRRAQRTTGLRVGGDRVQETYIQGTGAVG